MVAISLWYYCNTTCLRRIVFVFENHSQEVVLALIMIREHRRFLIWVSFK